MANKVLRIGIIGRHFGDVHASAFKMHDDCEVVSVVSHDWQPLVNDASIDAVSIAVPPLVQRQIAFSALSAKKHVLLEKPITANYEIAQTLLSKTKEMNVVAMVNFEFPFMKTWTEAKRQIDSGDLGRLQQVDIVWNNMSFSRGEYDDSWKFNPELGGGILNNFCCHTFNYLEFLFGRLDSIVCRRNFISHGKGIRLDVALTMNIKTKMGLDISVKMDGRGPKSFHQVKITGSKASLLLENTSGDYVSGFTLKKDGAQIADEKQSLQYGDGRIWATHQVAKRFVESIQAGKLNSPNLSDGVRTEELIMLAKA